MLILLYNIIPTINVSVKHYIFALPTPNAAMSPMGLKSFIKSILYFFIFLAYAIVIYKSFEPISPESQNGRLDKSTLMCYPKVVRRLKTNSP